MALPRRRFAKPVSSRRYLSLRHARRAVRALDDDPCDPDKEAPLDPGYEHLHSFFVPGLTAGNHIIEVTQDLSTNSPGAGSPELQASNSGPPQEFLVQAPRFELPDDAVYTVYPPPGQDATNDVLPHVLFNDPTLPWERIGSPDAEDENARPDDYGTNRVPWLACFTFTPEELRLSDAEMQAIFVSTSISGSVKQNETMAVNMPMNDLLKLNTGVVLTPFMSPEQEATKPDTNVVFLPTALFNAVFASYDENNVPHPSKNGRPDVSRHRFLAHLREINTLGMASAGAEEEQTQREFSVVVSNRSGPYTSASNSPTPVIVHVVSIEGVEQKLPFPISDPKITRVALTSLYSWTYMCLPPSSLDVEAAFENLSLNTRMLRPDIDFAAPPGPPNPAKSRLMSRLKDGFIITRHRVQTGEETAALMRGPLTPTVVEDLDWDLLSNSGGNLQILDKELGMMDISYSVAWSLGRTLALADRAYTVALTRVRRQILKAAGDQCRSEVIKATGTLLQNKKDLIRSMAGNVAAIRSVADAFNIAVNDPDTGRYANTASAPQDLSYRSSGVAYFLDQSLDTAAYQVAGTTDKTPPGWNMPYDPPYNELNTPVSPDWVLVLRFVLDLYHLIGVPSNYLLTDESYLTPETFRLFFVDHNWVDALIDGALSLGNHGELGEKESDNPQKTNFLDDPVRRSIKKAVNRYLETPIDNKYRPPVPRFGFYIRSAVVAAFPDLKVTCDPEIDRYSAPMLLRHEIIDKDVMLGFFGDLPRSSASKGVVSILFTMPPHQQYFSVGDINAETLAIKYKRIYTVKDPNDKRQNVPIADIEWKRTDNGKGTRTDDGNKDDKARTRSPIFIWGSDATKDDLRILLVEKLAEDVHTTLKSDMNLIHNGWYTEERASAAMMGIQLNSPAWQLLIGSLPDISSLRQRKTPPYLTFRKAPERQGVVGIKRRSKKKTMCPIPSVEERVLQPGLKLRHAPPHLKRVHVLPERESKLQDRRHLPSEQDSDETSISDGAHTPDSSWSLVPTPDASPRSRPQTRHEPFVPTIETLDSPKLSYLRSPQIKASGLAQFQYAIYPSTKPGTTEVPIVPTRQDLIFSIIYVAYGRDFPMTGFNIIIPVDDPDQTSLMDNVAASGPSANMLGNLRFNVRASISKQQRAMFLSIKPRSTSGKVSLENWVGKWLNDDDSKPEIPLLQRTELSVVLNNVKVVQYEKDSWVKIWYDPQYLYQGSTPNFEWLKLVRPKK